ncbi:hypothetical protein BwSH20_65100 [Bradyrhizobium ottawaense]|nr:hypothetical protein SG09_69480 [Bradyrhizobium ottawaense]BBO11275.1 hypothetical protein TM102_27450 [Bradyrhizobium sp. TM102]GMO32284.1 hypothetical protein BwSF21_35760 [Bradyrhizobium ottawaense]GMO32678.1 hypothetical protein BwSF12_31770 [Bradyrhizobium ottawaense]GMO33738.1 hypothetical protein BwSH14_37530 [Bradyrhizobium ottawaense]
MSRGFRSATLLGFPVIAFMGVLMPETLETLLWCAALATWLMLSFRIISERLKPLSNLVSHLLEVAFRHKAK